jgi:hypothetical protein
VLFTECRIVPIYDARGTGFDFSSELQSFARHLPAFEGEIPGKSLITVLYSANTYRKKTAIDKQLSLNIQAVIVLGTLTD